MSLLAYPITAFLVHEPWATILRATFVPHIQFSVAFFYVITAVIGTTISPYMFFWQTSQEVEENLGRPARRSLRDLRTDHAAGMVASQVTTWFIIIVAGTARFGHQTRRTGVLVDMIYELFERDPVGSRQFGRNLPFGHRPAHR